MKKSHFGRKRPMEEKEKIRNTMIGRKPSLKSIEKMKKTKKERGIKMSERCREASIISNTGRKHTPEFCEHMRNLRKGKTFLELYGEEKTLKIKEKLRISQTGKLVSKETREKNRLRMLNGGAAKIHRFRKNPSEPERKLREIVKELYQSCIYQYVIFNYAIDVVIPEYKIAIEYDGYYHFYGIGKSKEEKEESLKKRKEFDHNRQRKIEELGWIFYRVTMFDKFPTKEEVKEKIKKYIELNKINHIKEDNYDTAEISSENTNVNFG